MLRRKVKKKVYTFLYGRMKNHEKLKSKVNKYLQHIIFDSKKKGHNIQCLSFYYKKYALNNAYGTVLTKENILLKTAEGQYYWNPAKSYDSVNAEDLIQLVQLYKKGYERIPTRVILTEKVLTTNKIKLPVVKQKRWFHGITEKLMVWK